VVETFMVVGDPIAARVAVSRTLPDLVDAPSDTVSVVATCDRPEVMT
jgi:hypothetical protein